MKCRTCKLLKYDGRQYRCPAHPWKTDVDVYTEHPGCSAPLWYPKYVEDRVRSSQKRLEELNIVAEYVIKFDESVRCLGSTYGYDMLRKVLDDLRLQIRMKRDELIDERDHYTAEHVRLEKGER